jgi:hypothetical protein
VKSLAALIVAFLVVVVVAGLSVVVHGCFDLASWILRGFRR